jgi:hydrogenase maturation protease
MSARVLVAGIGNIFLGDDAFGVEVARVLGNRGLAGGVRVRDFGIRSFDLAYALDTIEVDLNDLGYAADSPDAHSMNPVKVLQLAQSTGEVMARIFVVGCEPEDCGGQEGRMGLTPAVQAAVEEGARMAEDLARRILPENALSPH